jgi:hypothetical protein
MRTLHVVRLAERSEAHRLVNPTSPRSRWRGFVQPNHGVVSQTGDNATPDERHRRQAQDANKYRLPNRRKACMAMNHDQGIGPGRRMNRLGNKHEAESEHLGQRVDPQ